MQLSLKELASLFPSKLLWKRRRKDAGTDSLDAESFSATTSPFSKVKGVSPSPSLWWVWRAGPFQLGKHSCHPKIRSQLQSLDLNHCLGVGWTTYEATLKSHFAAQFCYLVPGAPFALISWWSSWWFWLGGHRCSLSITVYPGEKSAVWLDTITHVSCHLTDLKQTR